MSATMDYVSPLGTPTLVQVSEVEGLNWVWGVWDPKTPLRAMPESDCSMCNTHSGPIFFLCNCQS